MAQRIFVLAALVIFLIQLYRTRKFRCCAISKLYRTVDWRLTQSVDCIASCLVVNLINAIIFGGLRDGDVLVGVIRARFDERNDDAETRNRQNNQRLKVNLLMSHLSSFHH